MLVLLEIFFAVFIWGSFGEYTTYAAWDEAEWTEIQQQNWSFVERYAPLVYLDKGEKYNPSSVEYHLRHTKIGGQFPNYWTFPKEDMEAVTILPWFRGQDVESESVPIYATVLPDVTKTGKLETLENLIGNYSATNNSFVVVYYLFFPYSRGKKVLGTLMFGSHIGDIERCYLRVQNGNPKSFTCEYHEEAETRDWDDVVKFNGTHPVIYAAEGSHALYFDQGIHEFSGKLAALAGPFFLKKKISFYYYFFYTYHDCKRVREKKKDKYFFLKKRVAVQQKKWTFVALGSTEWAGIPYFLYIYRWGGDAQGIAAKDVWTLNQGGLGFLSRLYDGLALDDIFAEGSLLCQGDDASLCPIPVGLWNEWPCLPGYQVNSANLTTNGEMACFLHPYGYGHENCIEKQKKCQSRQIVEPAFACLPSSGLCGQKYGSSAWSDDTNSLEGGLCPLQTCRSYCEVQLPEVSSFPNDIPHWYQSPKGEWHPYVTNTQYNDTTRFDSGTSCSKLNHDSADRYHNVPRSNCLAGFVYSASTNACYISSYQISECNVARAFPPQIPNVEGGYTCFGSNDTCGDGWVGYCDDFCQNSICYPAQQPYYEELMRWTHYVCDVNGNWISFADYQNSASQSTDGLSAAFSFDGTNATKFTCEIPTKSTSEGVIGELPKDNTGGSGVGGGNTDGGASAGVPSGSGESINDGHPPSDQST
ncbi:hypothetical protein RFI_13167, partial [Reticulomyxa filosa]